MQAGQVKVAYEIAGVEVLHTTAPHSAVPVAPVAPSTVVRSRENVQLDTGRPALHTALGGVQIATAIHSLLSPTVSEIEKVPKQVNPGNPTQCVFRAG
jgi:hypothetical protein